VKKEMQVELRVGVLITFAIAILFILTFTIGKFSFFQKGYNIKVAFNFVEGMDNGAPVRMAGVRVGNIKEVNLQSQENKVVLSIRIDGKTPIRKDSKFYLNTLGLMGEKYIEIDPGVSSEFLKNGDFVAGQDTKRMEDMIRQGQEILGDASRIVKSISKFTDNISTKELEDSISDVLKNLNMLTSDVKDIASNKKSDIETTITKLKESMVKLEKITTSLSSILAKIDKGEGAVGVLVSDKQVASDLKEIVANFKVFSKDVKDHPSWLVMGKPESKKEVKPVKDTKKNTGK